MSSRSPSPPAAAPCAGGGFTLLELLVVVAILAAVASLAYGYMGGVQQRLDDDADRVQIAELARALRQFRADTGFYPRQGPFRLSGDNGSVTLADCTSDCFYSPANLGQLLTAPCRDEDAAQPFGFVVPVCPVNENPADPAEPRRWRGPYLQINAGGSLRYVDVGSGLLPDGQGSPTAGAHLRVPGLPDARRNPAADPAGWFNWYLQLAAPASEALMRRRPLLFIADELHPRVVAFGPDGQYAGVNPTDPCAAASGSDDLVVCL